MKYLILAVFLSGCTCTTKIEIYSKDGGTEVKEIQVKESKVILEKWEPTYIEETDLANCTHPGYCFTCGLEVGKGFKCGMGFFYQCPGFHYEKTLYKPYIYHIQYVNKDGTVYNSVRYKAEQIELLESGACR